MSEWSAALEASVRSTTPEGVYAAKTDAAEQLKPLLQAQLFSEIDVHRKLAENLNGSFGLAPEIDPMLSKAKAKGGKLRLLRPDKYSGASEELDWQAYYFCLVDTFIYYYKEVARPAESGEAEGGADGGADEGGNDADLGDGASDQVKWKGCINLKVAKVGGPPEGTPKASRCLQVTTPLRTFVMMAKHDVSAEEWIEQARPSREP